MKVFQIPVGPMQNFAYLVEDEKSKEAMAIDSGWETDPIVKLASSEGMRVKYACATHGHFDHVKTIERLASEPGAETVAFQLQQVGIRSRIEQLERATGFDKYKNREFKVYFFTWPENPEPDRYLYSLFHSKARGYYYKNAEADRLLDLGRSTFDLNKRRKVYQQFHKFIVGDAPWVFLYTQKTGFGVRQRVKWDAPWDSFIRVVDADVAR